MSGSYSAGIATLNYALTPRSGDQFLSAARAVREANLLSLADGDGMIYTSTGHNLAFQVAVQQLAAHLHGELGGAAYTRPPVVSGNTLRLPAGRVYLDGEGFSLWGPETDGSQLFDLTRLDAGDYALVLETWRSLVGVTTYGRATTPSFAAGVVSPENKPESEAYWRAGNVDSPLRVSDAPFITGTLETQRPVQRQYRLRLVRDASLVGTLATASHPADRAGTLYAGTGAVLTATSPYSPSAYDVAVDRTFHTCKLALVQVRPSGHRVLVNAPHLYQKATAAGQNPIRVVPPAAAYQRFVAQEFSRVDTAHAALAARTEALERFAEYGVYEAASQELLRDTDQRLFFTSETQDALGWHDSASVSNRFTPDFEGGLQVICHATFAPGGAAGGSDGLRELALYLGGADTGARVTQLAAGGAAMGVQLVAEVDVRPGDTLEIAARHASAAPTLNLSRARLTLRRTR